jgi:hypothetical protein
MNIQSLLIGTLLFFSTGLVGQTFSLEVTVLDATTDSPLEFAAIQLAGTARGGTTDGDGRWAADLTPGRYLLVSSLLGYEQDTAIAELNGPLQLTLHLRPAAQMLSSVTVTTNDVRSRLERPVMGVEQLNIEAIKVLPVALGEIDIFRGLQQMSGVSSAGEASNGLSVRGGTLDQNLLLLDDAPVFTPTHLFGLFSVFTPDAVQSVNLYRGNIPARYGGRISSVMDVRNKVPQADQMTLRGGVGLVSSRLAIETPLSKDKRWQLLAAGRAGVNDFLLQLTERLKNNRSRFSDATVKLRWTANAKDIFTLTGFYSKDFYQIDLLSKFNGIIAENNQYDYLTLNGTAEWLHILGDKTSLVSKVIRANHVPKLLFPEFETDNVVEFRSRIVQTEARVTLDHQFGEHALSFGAQATHYGLSPGRLDPDGSTAIRFQELEKEQGSELSLFAEEEWRISEVATISAGLRYTRYAQLGAGSQRLYEPGEELREDTQVGVNEFSAGEQMQSYGGFEPRLGLSLRLHEKLRFKAAYAITRQYLQNIYNSTTPLPTSRWKLSDNHLQPQKARLLSAGLYATAGERGRFEISVEGYHRKIHNLLEYKAGADFFLSPTVETQLLQGKGLAYGLEVGVRETQGDITFGANYTYARVRNQVEGPSFTTSINGGDWYNGYFDQPHTFNGTFNFDDGKNNRVGFTLVAQSNRPFTEPSGVVEIGTSVVPLFLERNNARMPAYHRLDFSWTVYNMSMRKRRWAGEWTLTIYNVYGRKNAINVYYQPRIGNGDEEVFQDSPLASYKLSIFGTPIVSLSYNFTFKKGEKRD